MNDKPNEQIEAAPISMDNMNLMLMMVGGFEGIQTYIKWGMPYAQQGLKEMYNDLREKHKEVLEKESLTSIGYSFIDTPKGLGVVLLGFRFFTPENGVKPPAKVSYPLEMMTLEDFIMVIIKTCIEAQKADKNV